MTTSHSVKIRIRHQGEIAIGPGKADLLEAIHAHGSISAAGRAMGMSYKRAWDLVKVMNDNFTQPLVVTAKGGSQGGGAEITPLGHTVLKIYRDAEQLAEQAITQKLDELAFHLISP